MFTLKNSELTIDVLDPITDRIHLGPRFCWGGYIWQVNDNKLGPLISGPEWPNPNPTPFNGQGLPESFRYKTRDDKFLTWNGFTGVSLGAGEIGLLKDGSCGVITPCVWNITHEECSMTFQTRHILCSYDYEIIRKIELNNRTIRSTTTLVNYIENTLNLEWFAHPFFALKNKQTYAELPEGTTLAHNPGFDLIGTKLIQKRIFQSMTDGHLDYLNLPEEKTHKVNLMHPILSHVSLMFNFKPSECLIWGNNSTFSIEPYRVITLNPNESLTWTLEYNFGLITSG